MRNNKRKLNSVKFFLAPFLLALAACSGGRSYAPDMADGYSSAPMGRNTKPQTDTNTYLAIKENDFIKTTVANKSSFSMCTSNGAYANMAGLIERGIKPSKDAVIIEQMLNYFSYSYQLNEGESLGVFNEVSDCPWNSGHKLASVAVKAKEVTSTGNFNFVFLIDVSGSMYDEMGNVKTCFTTLIKGLSDNDRVSIVTYASGVNTVVDGASAKDKDTLIEKVNGLMASGSTNGSGGIQKAYEIASKHLINGGNNRVILATDGDFNVGISKTSDLEKFIANKRDSGIYLSVIGFGMGNYHDSTAQTLARNGNGNVFYVSNENDAKNLFVNGLSSMFEVVSKDTKTQVVFDVNQVDSYRLLGYENALLTEAEFNDSNKDAGEVLSGDVTVAMYEIVLKENADLTKSLFTTEIHFKDPKTNEDKVIKNERAIYNSNGSMDFVFQSAVVEFGLLLRDSAYKGEASYDHILDVYANNGGDYSNDENKVKFFELVTKAKQIVNQNY